MVEHRVPQGLRGRGARLALAALLLLAARALPAHPHVYMEARMDFEMRGRECIGLWVEWSFDQVFSAMLIGDFDADRDGSFSAAESAVVQAKAFSNLSKYGYFTFIRKGATRSSPTTVDGFRASQSGGVVTYRFHMDLAGKGYAGDFSVAIFDPTFYCAIKYRDAPASVVWSGDRPAKDPRVAATENRDYPVYYNPAGGATDTRTYSAWAPGLMTAYPTEVRVVFE